MPGKVIGNVYEVSINVRVGSGWMARDGEVSEKKNVLAGDAMEAGTIVTDSMVGKNYATGRNAGVDDNARVNEIEIIEIELVARDVIQ